MSTVYYKSHKVPFWLLIDLKGAKLKKTLSFLTDAGAKEQKWPSPNYYEFLQTYKTKGWAHALKPNQSVDTQLLARSCNDFVKSFIGPKSQMALSLRLHHNRHIIDNAEQGAAFFDRMLEEQDDIGLSQAFQTADINTRVLFTVAPTNKKLLTRLAERVIVISDSQDADLNLADTKPNDVEQALRDYFTQALAK